MSDDQDLAAAMAISDEALLDFLKAAVVKEFNRTRKASNELLDYGLDMQEARRLILEYEGVVHDRFPSDKYPEFHEYLVVLKLPVEGYNKPFYVKAALPLPEMDSAELISFHEWGLHKR